PFAAGEPPRLLFPNARFIVGQRAWERSVAPHPRDRVSFIPGLDALLERSGRLERVAGEHCESLGPAVRFWWSEGHTPGLMLAEVGGEGGFVFCSDLIPGRAWVHLPVTMGYDRYPERLIDEKRAFLDDKIARGVRLFFTHDPSCAAALPVRDGARYRVVDERPSLDGLELG